MPSGICAKWAAAVAGSCRKRSAIQPAVKCCVDAVIAAHRRGGVARHAIGGCASPSSSSLRTSRRRSSHHWSRSTSCGRILRRGEDQLAGFFRLVVFAQPLHARENIAGVAARGGRHRVEQRLGIVRLADHRGARAARSQFIAAEPFGCAHAGLDVVGIEALLHARLVVGAGEHVAEHLEHFLLDVGAALVVAPGVAHQRRGAGAVALREQGARQHVAALGGGRLLLGEKGAHRGVVEPVVPQRVLGAAAEQRRMRPARIGVHEGGVALETRIGVVAAQDHPFGELARDRIGDGLCRRRRHRLPCPCAWPRSPA